MRPGVAGVGRQVEETVRMPQASGSTAVQADMSENLSVPFPLGISSLGPPSLVLPCTCHPGTHLVSL